MPLYRNPYISKVQIKNYRNFLDVNVNLDHKQVIIGENNVGKTNFLRAIQLILDKDFSDSDRQLSAEDFHDSIENPMEVGAEIEIKIQIKGYEHNRKLKAQFADAVVSDNPPTLQFVYRFQPVRDSAKNIVRYDYAIYMAENSEKLFRAEHRSFINIYVIKALRDAERELKPSKNSPLYKLVKQYEISPDALEDISEALKIAAEGILELDEIIHIKNSITGRFQTLSGLHNDTEVTFRTFDMDTERLLYNLQAYMGLKQRPVSELSLGLSNILLISLILLLIKDKTITPVIKEDAYEALKEDDTTGILDRLYELSDKGNYVLKNDIAEEDKEALYRFMDEHNYKYQPFTILAVEEPEAHLHPVLQRLIYREVLHNSNTSVIFTSHSPYITAVTPLQYIVHISRTDVASSVTSTVGLNLEQNEIDDLERYVDAKRGEIYFGKGVIFVEGITEEYIVPAIAKLEDSDLDFYGAVVCNIASTNFKPYVRLIQKLGIPWVIITDGDYYERKETKAGSGKKTRDYHVMHSDSTDFGYAGNENVATLLVDLGLISEKNIPEDIDEQNELFRKLGAFIGEYTLEVDIMNNASKKGIKAIKDVFSELKNGGARMQENFDNAIDSKNYWDALERIENNIGKGRFAQRLAGKLSKDLIPEHVSAAILMIIEKITDQYE